MLDFRIQTFLQLCKTMNYRKTAELLNMTQPSVTQHIQFLEREYGCKLFQYDRHVLTKTIQCEKLERKIRSIVYIDQELREELKEEQEIELHIGATKTIAEYILPKIVRDYIKNTKTDFTLMVDNTEVLLRMIDEITLDFALIEGFFDKSVYGHKLFKTEAFVGICAKDHPFAGREIGFEQLLKETLLIREEGSGTRMIFEDVLHNFSHSIREFKRLICISHFSIIKELVAEQAGITFAYQSILQPEDQLAVFSIAGITMEREFNFVYLSDTKMDDKINIFLGGFD